jgi:hypothetical protein
LLTADSYFSADRSADSHIFIGDKVIAILKLIKRLICADKSASHLDADKTVRHLYAEKQLISHLKAGSDKR